MDVEKAAYPVVYLDNGYCWWQIHPISIFAAAATSDVVPRLAAHLVPAPLYDLLQVLAVRGSVVEPEPDFLPEPVEMSRPRAVAV